MPEEIQPGDVVKLKSGGPLMTVEKVTRYQGVVKASCQWFTNPENGSLENGLFPPEMLRKVPIS